MKAWRDFFHNHYSILLIILFGSSLRLVSALSNPLPDYDEATYIQIATRIMEGYLPYRDFILFRTPFHTYLLAVSFLIVGAGTIQCRLLSVIFGALTIVEIYWIGKEIANKKIGLVSSTIYSINLFSIRIDSLGNAESLNNFLVLLSILFLVRWIKSSSKKCLVSSSIAYVLAIYVAIRGALFALPAYLLVFFFKKDWKTTLLFISTSVLTYAILCAPFIVLSPKEFFMNVFLFNIVRNQETRSFVSTINYLINYGSFVEIILGPIGILTNTILLGKQFLKLRNRKISIKTTQSALFLILLLSFFTILNFVGFIHPYLVYPVWPILCIGASLLIFTLFDYSKKISILFNSKDNIDVLQRRAIVLIIIIISSLYAFQINNSLRIVVSENRANEIKYYQLKSILEDIERNFPPTTKILTTLPEIYFFSNLGLVLPPPPHGGTIDLFNYFHYLAMVSIIGSNPTWMTLVDVLLNPPKDIIVQVEKETTKNEFLSLVNQSNLIIIHDYFRDTQPGYTDTLLPILKERCTLIEQFDVYDIELYRVN